MKDIVDVIFLFICGVLALGFGIDAIHEYFKDWKYFNIHRNMLLLLGIFFCIVGLILIFVPFFTQ